MYGLTKLTNALYILDTSMQNDPHLPSLQIKLRNAARSRLNRWVKPHKMQPALDAPEWLVKEWKSGNKNDISQLLSHCNFNKACSFH